MIKRILIIFLATFPILGKAQVGASDLYKIILELNPENFKLDFTSYDKATAIYCAQVSEIAYWNDADTKAIVSLLNVIYPNAKYICERVEEKTTGTQLILWGSSKYIIIGFRGTEFTKEFKDIVVDGKFFRYFQDSGFSELPCGHGGFRRCIMNLITNKNIFKHLREFQNLCTNGSANTIPIYTTGHSLGAALATLIIKPLVVEGFNFSGAYNFAPPLAVCISDTSYLNAYHHIVYDVVNYLDYVTRAGSSSRKNLAHFGKFYRICDTGIINEEDEKRNGKYVSHPWGTKFKLYKFHKLGGYIEGLRNPENSNNDIKNRKLQNQVCF